MAGVSCPHQPSHPFLNDSSMESPTKKLYQQRAVLKAQQGDPEAPASGTLYARRHRLEAELRQVRVQEAAALDPILGQRQQANLSGNILMQRRSAMMIERDLRFVQREIDVLQEQIDDVDTQIKQTERKNRRRKR